MTIRELAQQIVKLGYNQSLDYRGIIVTRRVTRWIVENRSGNPTLCGSPLRAAQEASRRANRAPYVNSK